MKTYIYTLSDPRNGFVRYVGKTVDPSGRFKNHIGKREHTHKGNWIESLRKLNLKPEFNIVDEVATEEWSFWEQHWIQTFIGWGFTLTNMNSGGGKYAHFTSELLVKHKASFTDNVRQDMREKAILNMSNPKIKATHKAATLAAMRRPEVKVKVGKVNDPANTARSDKVRAQWADLEFAEKRKNAMLKGNATPEAKAKRSANAKAQFADGDFNKVVSLAWEATRKPVKLLKVSEERCFNCLTSASKFLGVNRTTVARAKLNNREINGWKVL